MDWRSVGQSVAVLLSEGDLVFSLFNTNNQRSISSGNEWTNGPCHVVPCVLLTFSLYFLLPLHWLSYIFSLVNDWRQSRNFFSMIRSIWKGRQLLYRPTNESTTNYSHRNPIADPISTPSPTALIQFPPVYPFFRFLIFVSLLFSESTAHWNWEGRLFIISNRKSLLNYLTWLD